jgi:hypothetical protein
MLLFLAIIIQMGHDTCDHLRDYLLTTVQFFSPFYDKTIRHDRYLHNFRFLHFSSNDNSS